MESKEAINRIKVMLVEKNRTSKWLSEQMGGNSINGIKMVYKCITARPK